MKAAPVAPIAFGLVSVIVITLVSPVPMELGVKTLVTVSRFDTVSVSLAGAVLEPAFVVVSAPAGIVFAYVPAAALVTFTVTVHEPLAGMVPPESATLVPLLAAVTVPAPQVVAPEGDAVFTRPAGYVSVNAAPVTAVAFGLVSVMVSTDGEPGATAGRREGLRDRRMLQHGERGRGRRAVPALAVVTLPVELR